METKVNKLLKPIKIGKYTINVPIFQGGMGVGISWDELAGNVSKEGGLGIISCVGTGYYNSSEHTKKLVAGRPFDVHNFYSKKALIAIFENARKVCGNSPLGANILYAINDYGRVVRDACEAGANIIVTGAGLPTNMPEFVTNFKDVALAPIVSSAKALKVICRRWEGRYKRIPDAVVVEGPLSGGHQGFKYEDCFKEENKLENIVKSVAKEAKNWSNIPIIAAGGIWDNKDINNFLDIGATGVQMATRFLGTFECDAKIYHKIMLSLKKEDIKLVKSPVGYPARAIMKGIMSKLGTSLAPKIRCISNCVAPCQRGTEARKVGYCIADSLSNAHQAEEENALFFTGANGYKIQKIITVKELFKKLIYGENA